MYDTDSQMDSVSTSVKLSPAQSDHPDSNQFKQLRNSGSREVRLKAGDLMNSLQFLVKVTRM